MIGNRVAVEFIEQECPKCDGTMVFDRVEPDYQGNEHRCTKCSHTDTFLDKFPYLEYSIEYGPHQYRIVHTQHI
jgi:predicted RNA-binding Zn-ribbon protein involved in translation (DUF1610 family)